MYPSRQTLKEHSDALLKKILHNLNTIPPEEQNALPDGLDPDPYTKGA